MDTERREQDRRQTTDRRQACYNKVDSAWMRYRGLRDSASEQSLILSAQQEYIDLINAINECNLQLEVVSKVHRLSLEDSLF